MDGGRASVRGAVARYAIAGLVALAVVAVVGGLVLDPVGGRGGGGGPPPGHPRRPRGGGAGAHRRRARRAAGGAGRPSTWWCRSGCSATTWCGSRSGRPTAASPTPTSRASSGSATPWGRTSSRRFATGETEAEVGDLSKPENRFERDEGSLLEVYLPIRTPDGRQALFELYRRESAVTASGRDLLVAIAPVLIGGLLLLWLIQLPLAWRGARRLEAGPRERERLLEAALESSAVERRRVAADLHDGPVQSLAGLSYSLAAAAQRAPEGTDPATVDALREGAESAREGIRRLRAAVVDINPGPAPRRGPRRGARRPGRAAARARRRGAARRARRPRPARGRRAAAVPGGGRGAAQRGGPRGRRARGGRAWRVADGRARLRVQRRRARLRRRHPRPPPRGGAPGPGAGGGPRRAPRAGAPTCAPRPGEGTVVELEVPA